MIICVCKWERNAKDQLVHVKNEISCILVTSQRFPEGTVLSTNRGKFFRSKCHLEISLHGWEPLHEQGQGS